MRHKIIRLIGITLNWIHFEQEYKHFLFIVFTFHYVIFTSLCIFMLKKAQCNTLRISSFCHLVRIRSKVYSCLTEVQTFLIHSFLYVIFTSVSISVFKKSHCNDLRLSSLCCDVIFLLSYLIIIYYITMCIIYYIQSKKLYNMN